MCDYVSAERKKALDGAAQEGQKFQASLDGMLDWLATTQDNVDSMPSVSGELDTLMKQSLEQEVSKHDIVLFTDVKIDTYLIKQTLL